MPIIRRIINALEQWIHELDYHPIGRDHLEAHKKFVYHLSLVSCSTIAHAFSFYILFFDSKIIYKIYGTLEELLYMDFYYGVLIHIYWILLMSSSACLILFRRHNSLNYYNAFVMIGLSLGTIFEYVWHYFTEEWLQDLQFCDVCDENFPIHFFIKLIQFYMCSAAIYKTSNAYLNLKEHQQILDTITPFKFISNASKGG
uniref:Uncharacterized protein n=2 Tax=Panagrolaimus davidi TaxID=227884 RepID=A0A914PSQ6_9BILA